MSNVASNQITVFPSTRRGTYQLSARQLSELRISGLINQLIDKEGFIITTEEDYSPESPFEFNLKGYYFRASSAQVIQNSITTGNNIYANIKLDTIQGTDYTELVGQDDTHASIPDDAGIYYGISFTSTPITDEGYYNLHLFTRDSSSSPWKLVLNSYYKFESSSLDFIVDGGEI